MCHRQIIHRKQRGNPDRGQRGVAVSALLDAVIAPIGRVLRLGVQELDALGISKQKVFLRVFV